MPSRRAGTWASAATWREALELEESEHIALMGGGGKTTTMWSMARELSRTAPTVVTSTTKAGTIPNEIPVVAWPGEFPAHALHDAMSAAFHASSLIALTNGERTRRLEGVSPVVVDEVFFRCGASHIINEADGARMKPFKAPAEREPVIASTTTVGAVMIGLDSVGVPIDDEHLHRSEIITALTGASMGDTFTPAHIATIVRDYLQRLEFLQSVRAAVIINKVDEGPEQSVVTEIIEAIADLDLGEIVAASQVSGLRLWRLN